MTDPTAGDNTSSKTGGNKGNDTPTVFLDAIKSQFEKEFDSAKNIDGKANNIIAAAGTVTGLLFGFGTFLIININARYEFLYYTIVLLILGIVSNIISVLLCVVASRIRNYQFAVKHFLFFKEEGVSRALKQQGENFNEDKINQFKTARLPDLKDNLIHSYLSCNKLNHELNEKKGTQVLWAQTIFMISLIIFPILVVLVLHAYLIGNINTPGNNKTVVYWNKSTIDNLIHPNYKSPALSNNTP